MRINVDNVFPFAAETSPALGDERGGGHVHTTDAGVHMYFPPGAFPVDTLVRIDPVPASQLPPRSAGTAAVLGGFDIGWGNVVMKADKRANAGDPHGSGAGASVTGARAIYQLSGGSETLMGGTVEGDTDRHGRALIRGVTCWSPRARRRRRAVRWRR